MSRFESFERLDIVLTWYKICFSSFLSVYCLYTPVYLSMFSSAFSVSSL